LGESTSAEKLAVDAELIAQVTSVNVACGFHAGNLDVMRATVCMAKTHGVAVGAHPGYPDLEGFGRRDMEMPPGEVQACVLEQIGTLAAISKAEGVALSHVKPHGALYNKAAVDYETALAIGKAIKLSNGSLMYCGLAGSQMEKAAAALNLRFASEVFADRAYWGDGTLVPRNQDGAIIEDVEAAATRVLRMICEGKVVAIDGNDLDLRASTVCIHGDSANAQVFATRIKTVLEAAGVQLLPMAQIV